MRHRELTIERVGGHGEPMIRLGGGAPLLDGLGPDPLLPHQPGHAVLADVVPPLDQGISDAGTAIGLAGLSVDHPDLRDERTVDCPARALRPHPPGIVAGG